MKRSLTKVTQLLGIGRVSKFLLFVMDIICLRFPLCVFPTQRKEKRKSVKERNKGRNERGIGGVQEGREDGEEEKENNW
jgi:hypothetical protein